MLALKFYDKREVHMLSTIHTAENAIFDKRGRNGQPKFKPSCIADYCKFMGGVDLSDQNMKYYCAMRKSHKLWKKLFFFFNMILTNNYALYRKYGANKKLKNQDFREKIARSLIMEAPEVPKPKPARERPLTNSDDLPIISPRKVPNGNTQHETVSHVIQASRAGDPVQLNTREFHSFSLPRL